MNISSALASIPDVEFRLDEPLARHTTFRVGGPVRLLARPRSEKALFALLEPIRELDIPFIVLGEGSNVLAPDGPWEMSVIQLHLACNRLLRSEQRAGSQKVLYAGAGTKLQQLVRYCIENGLEGLESLAGIPATVGGAIVMNASTSLGAISDSLVDIDLLGPNGERRSIRRDQLTPGYRAMGIPESSIVLGARFKLRTCSTDIVKARVEQIIKNRRQTQPLRFHSAGSIFKNPVGRFAGSLIEKAGLKGYRIGDAEVSRKHANWIVNRGHALARDIIELVERIENEVYGIFGVRLEREIRILELLYRNPAQ
ncbi:UDP-N-acetylenolpyruvoylglucosamine reductase [Syntrophobacter sp. SbD2]|nr:UDP-N-acetylenolpyruvoylglucosamine reductase [Syntrophobacter sp. SbD2]